MRSRTTVAENLSVEPNSLISNWLPVESLFSALNRVKLGIAVVDRRFRFRAINRVLAEMNNLPPEAHAGKPLGDVLGTLIAKVEPPLERVFTTGQPLPNIHLSGQLPRRSEPVQWLQYFFPLVDNRGRVVEVGAFVMERKLEPVLTPAMRVGAHNTIHTPHANTTEHSGLASAYPTGLNLTGREHEVLRLLAGGNSNKEISFILGISVKTVETYRSRVMLKIHAPSLTYLVHYAIRHQIVALQG